MNVAGDHISHILVENVSLGLQGSENADKYGPDID